MKTHPKDLLPGDLIHHYQWHSTDPRGFFLLLERVNLISNIADRLGYTQWSVLQVKTNLKQILEIGQSVKLVSRVA